MAELCRVVENYEIPVSAKPLSHYFEIFPEVFPVGQDGKVLVVGSGLSSIALQEGVVALDPGYEDPHTMLTSFFQNEKSVSHFGERLEVETALLHSPAPVNSHFVAGKADSDFPLPFAPFVFDHIVSSNFIFSGHEINHDPEDTTNLILNLLRNMKSDGSIQLFPHFVTPPNMLVPKLPSGEDMLLYETAYLNQNIVIDNLRSHGLQVKGKDTNIRRNRVPSVLQTVVVRFQ